MPKRISTTQIALLERRIAAKRTTAKDVDLLHRIIEQITFEVTGGNYDLSKVRQ